jgi:Ca2+-binding RTX toxin-like protein
VLAGRGGADLLDGGDGDDSFEFSGTAGSHDTVDGGDGADTIRALANGTVIGLRSLASIATVTADGFTGVSVHGSGAGDTLDLTGTTLTGIEQVNAGGGNDVLTGSAAADTLWGGSGRDQIVGRVGDDTLDGGTGADRAVYAGLLSSYTITAAGGAIQIIDNNPTADGNDGTDTLTGIEAAEFKSGVTVALAASILQPRDDVGLLEIAQHAVDPDWAWGFGA